MRPPFILFGLFSLLLLVACTEKGSSEQIATAKVASMNETPKTEKVLRHVVLFKFKDDADETEVNRLNEAFNALATSIPVVRDFEWGLNDSPEDLHQGFTHCYLLTFDSEADRDSVYAPHPEHKAFVARLQPYLDKALVVDYWTNP